MAIEPALPEEGGIGRGADVGSLPGGTGSPREKEKEEETVWFRGGGAGGVWSASSCGEARGVPRSSSAAEKDTWVGEGAESRSLALR